MKPLKLMWQTAPFLLLQVLLQVVVLVPAFLFSKQMITWGVKFTGTDLLIAEIMFAYVGLVVFVATVYQLKRLLGYVVRYAQIAAASEILATGNKVGLGFGFSKVGSRVGATIALMFADRVIREATTRVTTWVVNEADWIPEKYRTGSWGNFFKTVVHNVVLHIDEVLLSYVYNKPEYTFWQAVGKGSNAYFKSWKTVLKQAVFAAVWMRVFSWVINAGMIVLSLWLVITQGVYEMLLVVAVLKSVELMFAATIMDTYRTYSAMIGFYEKLDLSAETDDSEGALSQDLVDRLTDLVRSRRWDPAVVEQLSAEIISKMQGDSEGGLKSDLLDMLTQPSRRRRREDGAGDGENAG